MEIRARFLPCPSHCPSRLAGLGDDDGAGANESGESRFEFYGSGAGHMLQEDFDKVILFTLSTPKSYLHLIHHLTVSRL